MLSGEIVWFWVLAVIAIGSAISVVAFANPVRSVLFLVVNFLTLAALYFTLQAQFIGAAQIIVYVGAILVLFLFVIMLLNLGAPELLRERGEIKKPIAVLLGLFFLAFIGFQVATAVSARPPIAPGGIGTAETIGIGLFTQWVFPFEVTSVLLLVGIIGSILLAKRKI
ncbi:MAG: NADH-quinone oxidoreductase subunit J [bacterium]|jgi:NADH-quinone oxidoreductase subunit J